MFLLTKRRSAVAYHALSNSQKQPQKAFCKKAFFKNLQYYQENSCVEAALRKSCRS